MSKEEQINDLPEKKIKKDRKDASTAKNTLLDAAKYLEKKYEFRYNVIMTELEYRMLPNGQWLFFDDRAFHQIMQELIIEGASNIPENRFKNLLYGRLAMDYNPIEEYLCSLPPWDGVDYLSQYSSQVGLEDETKRSYFEGAFTKWFVAMVASLVNDRISNQTCLIFSGPQGNFKTTFLNGLVPKHLQLDYLCSAKFMTADKDHEMYLGTKMLINLDELATFNKTDVESLKSVITQDRVILRKAYGKANTRLWRRASFCGSINKDQFLTDFTGSRRFLVFQITTINIDSSNNLDNCYRQALHLYKTGFQYWFDKDEIQVVESNNQRFYDTSMEEELIMRHYMIPTEEDYGQFDYVKYYQTTDLAMQLASKYNKINVNDTYKKRLGQALKKLGYVRTARRINHVPSYVWPMVEKSATYGEDIMPI